MTVNPIAVFNDGIRLAQDLVNLGPDAAKIADDIRAKNYSKALDDLKLMGPDAVPVYNDVIRLLKDFGVPIPGDHAVVLTQ